MERSLYPRILHRSDPRPYPIDLYLCEYPKRIGLEYFQFILCRQKLQAVDHGNQIIRRFSGLWAHRAAGSWRFRAEKRLIDAALLDGGIKKFTS